MASSGVAPSPPHHEATAAPAARGPAASEFTELSLLDIGRWLWRHRRAIAAGALAGMLLAAGKAFTNPRTYTATASLLPQSGSNNAGNLAGLAAQFGVTIGSEPSHSPAFYADLLEAPELLGHVAEAKYPSGAGDSANLIAILGITDGTPAQQRERAIRELQRVIRVNTGRETGMVRLTVTAGSPLLANQIATRLLETLNDFNLRLRQEQARAEQTFARERLDEIEAELRMAEDRLRVFLRQNRVYRNSPDLMAEYERLERDVSMRRQIYMSMQQAYEQARIDAVRSTPVISVVERPSIPASPDSRRTVPFAVVGLLLGSMAGAAVALVRGRRPS